MIKLLWFKKAMPLGLLSVISLAVTLSIANFVNQARSQNLQQPQPPEE